MNEAPRPFEVSAARGAGDLRGILALQEQNLATAINADEAAQQGFVTVSHELDALLAMHALAPSIVARAVDGGAERIVGYALAMPLETRRLVPILEPMFQKLDTLSWRAGPLSGVRYYVMGQVCVAKAYRGQGVFDALYRGHRDTYAGRFELLVTEIAARNIRSLRAHQRVGFELLERYRDDVDDWLIVGWDWRPAPAPGRLAAGLG